MSVKFTPRTSRRNHRQNADINITPMVDVMLVLLIVFMVTAPMMTIGIKVDLPNNNAVAIKSQKKPLVVTIKDSGQLYLQETKVTKKQFIGRMKAIVKVNSKTRIFVRGDKTVPYGKVMEVMSQLAKVGFKRVALITQPLQ